MAADDMKVFGSIPETKTVPETETVPEKTFQRELISFEMQYLVATGEFERS